MLIKKLVSRKPKSEKKLSKSTKETPPPAKNLPSILQNCFGFCYLPPTVLPLPFPHGSATKKRHYEVYLCNLHRLGKRLSTRYPDTHFLCSTQMVKCASLQ